MVNPNEIQPITDADNELIEQFEHDIDAALKKHHGYTSHEFTIGERRFCAYFMKKYHDAGWVVQCIPSTIGHSSEGLLMQIIHPDVYINFG
ncbi:MAG: hypothetical protein QM820_58590 [Minicystis sp.]